MPGQSKNLKMLAQDLYARHIDETARRFRADDLLNGQWISAVRQALGMSSAQLARRMGKSRALLSRHEKAEAGGAITIATMKEVAKAMNCCFVYAIVPETKIEKTIAAQALSLARKQVRRASEHMALEGQMLDEKTQQKEVKRLADELARERPRALWEVDK